MIYNYECLSSDLAREINLYHNNNEYVNKAKNFQTRLHCFPYVNEVRFLSLNYIDL